MIERTIELHKQAENAYTKKQYQEAIDLYNQIIALDDRDAEAYNNRGNAYYGKGEHDKALDDYTHAIELKSGWASPYYNRGIVYNDIGEHDQAIYDYTKAIELEPDKKEKVKAYSNRGVAHTRKGQHDQAIYDYTKVIGIAPELAEPYNNRGNAYYRNGEHQKAHDDYNEAIRLNPDYADAYYNLGVAYRLFGKESKALKYLKKANELDPTLVIHRETQETQKKVEGTQNFQIILKELKDEFEPLEKKWFWRSFGAVIITAATLIIPLFLANIYKDLTLESINLYAIYGFSSLVTMIIIRQYTNAKQLRIEASNRMAMARMFARVNAEKMEGYKEFMPSIITSIVYSMHKDQNTNNNELLALLKSFMDKK